MAVYVLDTSAVTAFLKAEPGDQIVRGLLEEARLDPEQALLLPFVVPMEVEYTFSRTAARDRVEDWLQLIEEWPAEIVESNSQWRRSAAQVKYEFPLSFPDAWVAALALMNDAELVHKDPEFDAIPQLKALRLPYTPSTRRERS